MELPLKLGLVKERKVKHSLGSRCELCGDAHPTSILEIHLIPCGGTPVKPGPDLQREILVLCPRCHRELHAFGTPRADQKDLVRARPAGARREIRAILGHQPEPYTPPEVDLAALYEETRQLSSFVLNGAG
jgi:hypothetical protein